MKTNNQNNLEEKLAQKRNFIQMKKHRYKMLKPIAGYHKLYMVSNDGEVWGCKRKKFLKPSQTEKGYLIVNLYKDGHAKCKGIHRLVAEAFIPNPENKPQVNHLDENPSNNHVENLEWATAQENCDWGEHNKKISVANKGKLVTEETRTKISLALKGRRLSEEQIAKKRKKVKCITTNEIFNSISEASLKYDLYIGNISKCCKGKRKYAGKLKNGTKLEWEYV